MSNGVIGYCEITLINKLKIKFFSYFPGAEVFFHNPEATVLLTVNIYKDFILYPE